VDVRGAFSSSGKLGNTQDTNFRPINQDWPVFGFATDLGDVTGSINTVYTLGLTQEEAIQFDGANRCSSAYLIMDKLFPNENDAVSLSQEVFRLLLTKIGRILLWRL